MEQKTQAEIESKTEQKEVQKVHEENRRKQIASYFNQSTPLDSSSINICGTKINRDKTSPTQQAHDESEPQATTE